ncbi:MAG: hypothetical protein E5V80_05200 [Mesorhizobium sp.]|nr:MAG: hypothetical protein E5V80_05200 [Mesorhizobium sp.]
MVKASKRKAADEVAPVSDPLGILREDRVQGIARGYSANSSQPPAPSKRRAERKHGVPRENILQLLPNAVAPSKEELTGHWRRVADRALVHLGGRPLKLVRNAS